MKASKAIEAIQNAIDEYGDLELLVYDNEGGGYQDISIGSDKVRNIGYNSMTKSRYQPDEDGYRAIVAWTA